MMMTCPACDRGVVDEANRTCNRCRVAVPLRNPNPKEFVKPSPQIRRIDQDRVNKYTDYVRTKEDKA